MGHMQNAPSLILWIALVVLLLLVAFSSGTEVAMLSANRYQIRAAAKAGKRTAKALDALARNRKLARREPGRARARERRGVFDRDPAGAANRL